MPAIGNNPFVIKDAIVQIGTDTYEAAVSTVRCDPEFETVEFQGMIPAAAYVDQTTPKWKLTLTFAQDWKTVNGLASYLLANMGTQKTMVFKPQGSTTGNPSFTVTVMIAPGSIGGDVNTIPTSTVVMGCVGQPVKALNP